MEIDEGTRAPGLTIRARVEHLKAKGYNVALLHDEPRSGR
jgi:hypothetical protein